MKRDQIVHHARIVTVFLALLIAFSGTSAAATEKAIYRFQDAGTGFYSFGGLTLDSVGNLYGTTRDGGAFGNGTVFELSLGQDGVWTETVLYSFKGGYKDGAHPIAGLVFDRAGNLYGTTNLGGSAYRGTTFQLSPDGKGGWTETILCSFYGKKGTYPQAGLVIDPAGNLYGTTISGGTACSSNPNGPSCGTVFRIKRNRTGKWVETVVHSFTGAPDGAVPAGGVVLDSAGNLYGATTFGGNSNNSGAVFKLARVGNTWTESVIYNFNFAGNPDGFFPSAGLVRDGAGNLYGTTYSGGDANNDGVVFRLTPNNGTWTESVLHAFGAPGDGFRPTNDLTLDSAGNLYGIAPDGISSDGKVFKLTPSPNSPWSERFSTAFRLTATSPPLV